MLQPVNLTAVALCKILTIFFEMFLVNGFYLLTNLFELRLCVFGTLSFGESTAAVWWNFVAWNNCCGGGL